MLLPAATAPWTWSRRGAGVHRILAPQRAGAGGHERQHLGRQRHHPGARAHAENQSV